MCNHSRLVLYKCAQVYIQICRLSKQVYVQNGVQTFHTKKVCMPIRLYENVYNIHKHLYTNQMHTDLHNMYAQMSFYANASLYANVSRPMYTKILDFSYTFIYKCVHTFYADVYKCVDMLHMFIKYIQICTHRGHSSVT